MTAVTLAGCGGASGSGGSPDEQIRTLFADMRSALEDEEWKDACELLSPEARKDPGPDCPGALERAVTLGGGPDILPTEVARIERKGDQAIVFDPDREQTKVIRIDGEWRFASDRDF